MIAETKDQFFYNVMVISFFIGSIQSASRVMMTKLLGTNDLGKGFGLFSFSGTHHGFCWTIISWNHDLFLFSANWLFINLYFLCFRIFTNDFSKKYLIF